MVLVGGVSVVHFVLMVSVFTGALLAERSAAQCGDRRHLFVVLRQAVVAKSKIVSHGLHGATAQHDLSGGWING